MLLSEIPVSRGDSPEHVSGLHPLACALERNNLSMTILLLDSGANIELKDNLGGTHLALAAMNGCGDITGELLRRGADPSVRDIAGQTALSGHTQ